MLFKTGFCLILKKTPQLRCFHCTSQVEDGFSLTYRDTGHRLVTQENWQHLGSLLMPPEAKLHVLLMAGWRQFGLVIGTT